MKELRGEIWVDRMLAKKEIDRITKRIRVYDTNDDDSGSMIDFRDKVKIMTKLRNDVRVMRIKIHKLMTTIYGSNPNIEGLRS